jgi:hypothetical protein
VNRVAWTLPEMIISLCVMAVAVGLASHAAVVHLRFFRGAGEIIATRSQVGAVGAIVAAAMWGVSPARGEIVFASDSALEVRTAVGSAVACDSATGRIIIPLAEPRGNTLTAFESPPESGDIADVFVRDSVGAGWMRTTVASSAGGGACTAFPLAIASTVLTLREPLGIPAGALVRVSRPVRLNHYRAGDGLWYFGVRDWNSANERLNTVQPAAGPLEPHSADVGRSGLTFRFFDEAGIELPTPIDPTKVAIVGVAVRAKARRPVNVAGLKTPGLSYTDSTSTLIALRNAR